MTSVFPLILATHVALAVSLLIPSVLLPFAFRSRRRRAPDGRVVTGLLWFQGHGTLVIGAGLAATGVAMLVVLGPRMVEQPWLLAALAIYAGILVVAYAVQRPGIHGLVDRSTVADPEAERRWRDRARRQRYVAYAMAVAVGLIAFLMSTKPTLW